MLHRLAAVRVPAHAYTLPALAGLPQGGGHQLQTASLGEETGNHLGASLLRKATFDEAGRANPFVVDLGTAPVSDANIPIFLKRAWKKV